ncbi:hypothetical protein P7K49_001567 [Saguinus oedipus]|uniref:Uncharacterized protein n=1 Tax=Saguinus oedipus TaxID=9490 RepID=A0ABQ9WEW2_SAGOE|nr:hypothetical protein P7K49_001567 [Saguinus oedipus]
MAGKRTAVKPTAGWNRLRGRLNSRDPPTLFPRSLKGSLLRFRAQARAPRAGRGGPARPSAHSIGQTSARVGGAAAGEEEPSEAVFGGRGLHGAASGRAPPPRRDSGGGSSLPEP